MKLIDSFLFDRDREVYGKQQYEISTPMGMGIGGL